MVYISYSVRVEIENDKKYHPTFNLVLAFCEH